MACSGRNPTSQGRSVGHPPAAVPDVFTSNPKSVLHWPAGPIERTRLPNTCRTRRQLLIASKIAAMPCPPPMHMVTSA
jgi:hypothetical protein